ncbi:MAG: RIP metalloprotease [Acidimicrobiia bacterium]|nr:RIP metalloprotease [Acidimicrobiia bacterium]
MLGGIFMLVAVVASVMIHESGHYFMARATGMKATEFFFGFGPKLWSTTRGETEYGIKAFPLGGYVRIAGMNPLEEIDPADVGRTYREKKFWQKSVVILAGVALHFIIAYVVILGAIIGFGIDNPDAPLAEIAVVQQFLEDGSATPASVAGLEPGDTIVAVGGLAVGGWEEIRVALADLPDAAVTITVNRDGDQLAFPITLSSIADPETGARVGYLGVSPAFERQSVGFFTATSLAGRAFVNITGRTFEALGNLVKPSSLAQLGGAFFGKTDIPNEIRPVSPVGIVRLGAESDFELMVSLVAMVNIVLGIFNGLPLYPLDGGHFAVAAYERITHRKADVRKLAPIAAVVMALVLFLFSVALLLDIVNPISLNG